jgi:hypothetical protein
MSSWWLAMLGVVVSATLVCADEVRNVEQETPPVPAQGNLFFNINCPSGFVPAGVRSINLFSRFDSLPSGEGARIQLYNPAGAQITNPTKEVIRLTCLK